MTGTLAPERLTSIPELSQDDLADVSKVAAGRGLETASEGETSVEIAPTVTIVPEVSIGNNLIRTRGKVSHLGHSILDVVKLNTGAEELARSIESYHYAKKASTFKEIARDRSRTSIFRYLPIQ